MYRHLIISLLLINYIMLYNINVTLQFYICKPSPLHIKKCITKIRLSSHNLYNESVGQITHLELNKHGFFP